MSADPMDIKVSDGCDGQGHGKVERALQRAGTLDLVAGQRPATLISSKNTNRLNRSPVRSRPPMRDARLSPEPAPASAGRCRTGGRLFTGEPAPTAVPSGRNERGSQTAAGAVSPAIAVLVGERARVQTGEVAAKTQARCRARP